MRGFENWLLRTTLSLILFANAASYTSLLFRRQQMQLYDAGFDEDASLSSKDRGSIFDSIVRERNACKSFQRFDRKGRDALVASFPDPAVVEQSLQCLEIARLAPSAFNTQPYKVVLVTTPEQKAALSKGCLGPNVRRVLDADCTAVFLADRQVFRTLRYYRKFISNKSDRPFTRKYLLVTQFYITLFSSGYPLPRLLASPVSFLVRTALSLMNIFSTLLFQYPLPSLANAETWASKQATLVAMTYMLGCTARGLATIPMEGINAGKIRRGLSIPSRYAIPLIVSTGKALVNDSSAEKLAERRYPMEDVIFCENFGEHSVRVVPEH